MVVSGSLAHWYVILTSQKDAEDLLQFKNKVEYMAGVAIQLDIGILAVPTKSVAEAIQKRGITMRMLYAFTKDLVFTPLDYGEFGEEQFHMNELVHLAASACLRFFDDGIMSMNLQNIHTKKKSTHRAELIEAVEFFKSNNPEDKLDEFLSKQFLNFIYLFHIQNFKYSKPSC